MTHAEKLYRAADALWLRYMDLTNTADWSERVFYSQLASRAWTRAEYWFTQWLCEGRSKAQLDKVAA